MLQNGVDEFFDRCVRPINARGRAYCVTNGRDDEWAIAVNRPGYKLAFLDSDGNKERSFNNLYGTVEMAASPSGQRLLIENFEQKDSGPSLDEMVAVDPTGLTEGIHLQKAACVNWWDETSLLVSYKNGPLEIVDFDGTKRELEVAEPREGCHMRSAEDSVVVTTFPQEERDGTTRITEHDVGSTGNAKEVGSYKDCSALPAEMHPTKRVLAVGATCNGQGIVLVVDLDSGESTRLVEKDQNFSLNLPSWTPDGESIVAGRLDGNVECCDTFSIVKLDLNGSSETLAPSGFTHPQVITADWLDETKLVDPDSAPTSAVDRPSDT